MSNSTWTQSPQKWVDEDCLHVNIFTSDKCLVRFDQILRIYCNLTKLSNIFFNFAVSKIFYLNSKAFLFCHWRISMNFSLKVKQSLPKFLLDS